MTKKYVSPRVEIHRVDLENVIAASPTATPAGSVMVEDFGDGAEYNSDDILLF